MTALAQSVFDFSAADLRGQPQPLAQWRGKVLLIVNTASACGFTPQYAGLQALQDRYGPQGFSVLAFPCNQFGAQEPGDAAEIADFCTVNYDVTFPVFAKIDVNGSGADPLFERLRKDAPGLMGTTSIKWNFTKFLVDRSGKTVRRYAPNDTPESLRADIEKLLAA